MRSPLLLATVLLAAGCATATPTATPTASPTATQAQPPTVGPTTPPASRPAVPPSASPAASQAAAPLWVVGAHRLPLRADGFGQVLPTPEVLRDRHLPTADLLPPPRDGAFHAAIGPITRAIRERMGQTYRPGCPVDLTALRYVTVSFRGFDGKAHTGEIVVAAKVAAPVVRIFSRLFAQRFPIEQMRLPTTADVTAPPTGDGNDTAGFVCRAARGQTRFSAHAYGLAIDVNPFHNPFVRDDLVLPELASAYRDRSDVRDGMFLSGSAAVRAFTREGWTWGGTFRRPKDYQHFSLTGN